ncbi:hypothetical protein ACWD0J_27870 [Streptomyces sp. NPDC003011]
MFYDAPDAPDALHTVRDEPAVVLARGTRLVRVHYGDAPAAWAARHHVGSENPGVCDSAPGGAAGEWPRSRSNVTEISVRLAEAGP